MPEDKSNGEEPEQISMEEGQRARAQRLHDEIERLKKGEKPKGSPSLREQIAERAAEVKKNKE
jgi:hypothetical protein